MVKQAKIRLVRWCRAKGRFIRFGGEPRIGSSDGEESRQGSLDVGFRVRALDDEQPNLLSRFALVGGE